MSLGDRLAAGPPLLLDGPMGTEIDRRGGDTRLPLWSARALIEDPGLVAAIHADYAAAGADIQTTNTFRANVRTLRHAGLADQLGVLVDRAVQLARTVGGWVAGSIAPVEDCYRPELVPPDDDLMREHGELSTALADAGVDVLLVETMNSVREAAIANAAAARTGIPTFLSVVCRADGRLVSGEDFPDLVAALRPAPSALLVNCSSLEATGQALARLRAAWQGPWGAYANVGTADPIVGWAAGRDVSTDEYVRAAARWLAEGASIIGSCCGTSPATTAALRDLIKGMPRRPA